MLCLYGLPLGISACRLTQGSGSGDVGLVQITARYIRLPPDSRVRISKTMFVRITLGYLRLPPDSRVRISRTMFIRITLGYLRLPPDSRVRISKTVLCADNPWVSPYDVELLSHCNKMCGVVDKSRAFAPTYPQLR